MDNTINNNPPEETRWKPGQSGNPNGRPKGSINLSTRIQNMLNDDEFTTDIIRKDGTKVQFKGNPMEAIIRTAILKSMGGDKMWAEWLAKNGWGTKQIHEFENSPVEQILEKYGLTMPVDKPKENNGEKAEDTTAVPHPAPNEVHDDRQAETT